MSYGLLIIGGGPAGLSAARAYRAAGGSEALGIVTDERRVPYRRPPLTKELLRQEINEDELPIEAEPWFSDQRVDLISGRAVSLDPGAQAVALSGGRELNYRECLLATGAEPARLPVPGADDPGVRVLRSLDDLRELRHRLEPGAEICVIGSGFIGCEIAASFRMLKHPVILASDETAPNERRVGEDVANRIRAWLEELGVVVRLGAEVEAIERTGDGFEVHAGDAHLPGALVIMATGVAPRSELASAAGVETDDGAIPVDASMETRIPGLRAAGDVCAAMNAAAGRRLRVEHWGDALGQGAIAGAAAAGEDVAWDEVPGFWSTIGRHTLKYAAWGDGFDSVRFEPGPNGAFAAWYTRADRLVGVLTHEVDEAYEQGRDDIAGGVAWSV